MKTKRIEVFNLVWALVERLQCQIQTQSQYTIRVHITKHKHKRKIQIPKVTSVLVGMFQCWSWRHFQEGDRPTVHDESSLEKITHIISQMHNTFSDNPFDAQTFSLFQIIWVLHQTSQFSDPWNLDLHSLVHSLPTTLITNNYQRKLNKGFPTFAQAT